jgi:ATP-dependent RNA helicase DeaD
MTTAFTDLNLLPQLIQAVTELGYRTPTPIQAAVIPAMLAGGDVIGQAQTGTGKTAPFTLPILHHLQPQQKQVQSLILALTRELALPDIHGAGMQIDAAVLLIRFGVKSHRTSSS